MNRMSTYRAFRPKAHAHCKHQFSSQKTNERNPCKRNLSDFLIKQNSDIKEKTEINPKPYRTKITKTKKLQTTKIHIKEKYH